MPEKEGSEDEKTTKGVVKKKQKQMMGEEGYDHYKDRMAMAGREIRSKDTKDASSYPQSRKKSKGDTPMQKEFKKKYGKKATALDAVKADITAKYGKGAIMNVKKEELDLTKIAEAFDGYIIEGRPKGNPFAKGKKPFKSRRSYDKSYKLPTSDELIRRMRAAGEEETKKAFNQAPENLNTKKIEKDAESKQGKETAGKTVEKQSGTPLGDLTYKELEDFKKNLGKDVQDFKKAPGKTIKQKLYKFFVPKDSPVRQTWRNIRREPVNIALTSTIARDQFRAPALPPVPTVKGGKVGKRTAG